MARKYHVTHRSANGKVGPIAVTTSTRDNCNPGCLLYGNGCYADNSRLGMHWRMVTAGERGTDLESHCAELRASKAPMVRLNQAGDLPVDSGPVPALSALRILDAACRSEHSGRDPWNGYSMKPTRTAWSYTHHTNHRPFLECLTGHARGLTSNAPRRVSVCVNASANNPAEALELHRAGFDVATLIPWSAGPDESGVGYEDGLRIVQCPEQLGKVASCAECGNGVPLCARTNRGYAIGFATHGTRKDRAQAIAARGDR